jgi:hypothetical protein
MQVLILCLVLLSQVYADNDSQDDRAGCSKAPIRLAGLKYLTRHAVNTTAPEVGLGDVVDVGFSHMKAFPPNSAVKFFSNDDVAQMNAKCKDSYLKNWGYDFNPATNPNATCNAFVGNCDIKVNGTTIASMYPFKEENGFDIRVLFNSKDTYMNCGGYIQVVYMTLMIFNTAGVVQPPALQAGQRHFPLSNAGCGWTMYWLKNSDPLGKTQGENNVKSFWLDTTRLGNFAPNPFVSSEAKITLEATDEDGNQGFYMDNQYINFKWQKGGQGVGTRFAQDEFIFPLDMPLSTDQWVRQQFSQQDRKRAAFASR